MAHRDNIETGIILNLKYINTISKGPYCFSPKNSCLLSIARCRLYLELEKQSIVEVNVFEMQLSW